MPISFRCPSCQAKLTARSNQAGQALRCPSCRNATTVPVPPSQAAPPPEPAPVPFTPEPAPEPPPLFEIDDAPAPSELPEPSSMRRSGPAGEPWYYRFLEGYAKIFVILFLVFEALMLLVSLLGALPVIALMLESREAAPLALVVMALYGLSSLLVAALLFFLVLFQCALILLAVDMGRNLRAIRQNTGERGRRGDQQMS